MKITAKSLLGNALRLILMGPLMLIRAGCDKAIAWLRHNLPGG